MLTAKARGEESGRLGLQDKPDTQGEDWVFFLEGRSGPGRGTCLWAVSPLPPWGMDPVGRPMQATCQQGFLRPGAPRSSEEAAVAGPLACPWPASRMEDIVMACRDGI